MTNWSSKDSLKVYNVPYWGAGFFNINDAGHVTVSPDKSRPEARIVLSEAIEQLRQSGLTTPVLLRFPDILKSRVDALFNAFGQAIEKSGYEGDYLCVYPIKVNQQRRVIDQRELDVGVGLSRRQGRCGEREANGEDERAALRHEAVDVRCVVGLGSGLDGDRRDAERVGCLGQARVAELVE